MPGDHGVVSGQLGASVADLISLGVLAASVPREVVDAAVAAHGRSARRAGGKLPPHVCATSREFAEVVTWIRTAVTALARAFVDVRGARAADEEGS